MYTLFPFSVKLTTVPQVTGFTAHGRANTARGEGEGCIVL